MGGGASMRGGASMGGAELSGVSAARVGSADRSKRKQKSSLLAGDDSDFVSGRASKEYTITLYTLNY